MKKSTKIILITSACLIFGGILIAGISGAVGGTRQFKQLVDSQALDFDLPWEDAKLKITTGGIYFTNEDEDKEDENGRPFDAPEGVTGNYEVDGEIKNVELNLGAGSIEVRKSKDGKVNIEADDDMRIECDYDDETLKISTKLVGDIQILGFSVGDVQPSGSATVYLPDQMYEELTLDMGAGEVSGDLPECKKMSVRLGAGECDLDYIKAEEVELEVGAGECTIGLLEAEEVNADIAMGEFKAKAAIGKDFDAKVGMGEIAMEIIGEEDDFDYDVTVGAGEVRIGTRSYSGVGSGGSQKNGQDREIEVDCGMGQATITFVED